MKNNRDDFDQCAALVFELLYRAFPKEIDVIIDELVEDLDEEMTDNYFATIRFLQRESLIHYQELHYSVFKGIVLTAKGLNILDTVSDTIKETVAQQISDALQGDNKKAIGIVIQEVIKLSI